MADGRTDGGAPASPRLRRWLRIGIAGAVLITVLATLQGIGVIQWFGKARPAAPTASPNEGGPWSSIFREDFDQDAPLGSFLQTYGPTWSAYPYPWTDTSRALRSDPGYYDANKTISVAGGVMNAWLHYDTGMKQFLVAAPFPRLPPTTYGRFVMRLQATPAPGYRIAPLLWPDSNDFPEDGEINMPEGNLTDEQFIAYLHFAQPATAPGREAAAFPTGVNGSSWHVYETAWSPGKVEFFVDGASIGSSKRAVPFKPMHWVLQFETQLTRGAPPKTAQANVRVDWVEAWSWVGPTSGSSPTHPQRTGP